MPAARRGIPRVLVTGVGGPSGISFMQVLRDDADETPDFFAGDVDPHAPGLYLVAADRRLILPRGDDPDFASTVLERCVKLGVEVVVPTVDSELVPLAERRDELAEAGVSLLVASAGALGACLDKWSLMSLLEGRVGTPRSELLDGDFASDDWSLPAIVKPRRGSGSRGFRLIEDWGQLDRVARDGEQLVQEHLPGAEYSIDVLAALDARVIAAVPRERLKVDSGIAITSRTRHDERLEEIGRRASELAGITGVANVQAKEDVHGVPRVIEINPRFPGTMALTVASGVNMPRLALSELLGEPMPAEELEFRDVALTRYLVDLPIDPEELGDQESAARRQAAMVAR